MGNKIEVKLDFLNKKEQQKHVKFYMDKKTYEILNDETIDEEVRNQYLIDEYHEYEKERYYQRKFVPLDIGMMESLQINEDTLLINEEIYDKEIINNELKKEISKLSFRQQEVINKIYFEGKKQIETAKELKVSKEYISKTLVQARKKLKKNIEKNKKFSKKG